MRESGYGIRVTMMRMGLVLAIGWLLIPIESLYSQRQADRPQALNDPQWIRLFAAQKEALRRTKQVDICFVGDSLTQQWATTGHPVWQLDFGEFACVNFGISADRTENILYRVWKGGFDEALPRVVVLLAGTNNLSMDPPDSPEEVEQGIRKIVEVILHFSPKTEVIVVSILPSGPEPGGPLRRRILKTNGLLSAIGKGERVTFVDVHDDFLNENGHWKPGLTTDGTHLSLRGYDLLGKKLARRITAILNE